MIDKVVILAAGQGRRIGSAAGTPKPYLSLDGSGEGETFVSWHVRRFAERGVRAFYVVGNAATVDWPIPQPAGCAIHRILNPTADLSTSGSGHSAWFAWQHEPAILDGR